MKFACDKCDTKYSIADEKVRGKVLKIRCKKCENVIVLREPKAEEEPRGEEPTRAVALDPATLAQLRSAMADGPAGQGATPAAAPARTATGIPGGGAVLKKQAPQDDGLEQSTRVVGFGELDELRKALGSAPAPAAASRAITSDGTGRPPPSAPAAPLSNVPEWYLAIKGQQIGPLSQAQVAARVAAGEADERTYGWKDGLGDWKRLSDIPELKPGPKGAAPPPPPPPPPPPAAAEPAEPVRRAKPRVEEPLASNGHGASDPLAAMMADAASDPFDGASPLAASAQDPFASVPDSSAVAEGAPRESTRMFIAAAGLANRGQKHKVYAGIASVVVILLGTVVYLDAMGIYQIPIAHDLVTYSFEALNVEPPKTRGRIEVDDMDMSALIKKKQLEEKKKGGGKRTPKPGEADSPDIAAGLNGAQDTGGDTMFERKGDDSAATGEIKHDTGVSDALKTQLQGGAAGMKKAEIKLGTDAPKQETKAPQGDAPLTAEQIGKVVGDQKASLAQCANDSAKAGEKFKGTAKVTVTIGPSGKVQKVAVNDPKIAGMTLGQCLGRALGRWIFPAFKGEPFEAELPLKLSVGP